MANTSRKGFWPVGTLSGATWQGSVRKYEVVAGAGDMGLGDLVGLEADGMVDVISANTCVIIGAIVGVLPVSPPNPDDTLALSGSTTPNLNQKYSSGAGHVLVCTAPDAIYEAETTDAIANSVVGETTNVSIATVDTTTGISKHAVLLDGAANGVGATAQLKIIDIVHRPDNDKTVTNTKVHVMINMHLYNPRAVGI